MGCGEKEQLPIGLFDSGIGGLTVLRALKEVLPLESYIYLGDTARLPYGTKSNETITRYALQASKVLMEKHIKLLVIACNTATSVALPALRISYPDIPVIGVVEPGAIAACKATKTNKIGVIATAATIRGNAYEKAIHAIKPEAKVYSVPCPLFVPMAEEGLVEGYLVEGIAERYLGGIFQGKNQSKPDCLVLGCTHFPLLAKALQNVVGNNVTLVDSAYTTALEVKRTLEKNKLFNNSSSSSSSFLTTDDIKQFRKIGEEFLGYPLPENDIELIDL